MFENLISVVSLEKFSKRVRECEHSVILERVNRLENLEYEVYGHDSHSFNPSYPVFTILLTVHDANLDYIKQSIQSIQKQTYENTELIIIDNGSTGAISAYINEIFLTDQDIKLLRVACNQYDPLAGDQNPIIDLWNAGLFASEGSYIYFQSYDDLLSPNYVESMVKLFQENPKCVSATPLVSSIDANSELNLEFTKALAATNSRGRYESGVFLAQNRMRGNHLINSPGGLLAQKSDSVIELGGFDSMNDLTQIFRFAIYGEVGFEPQAMLYWRHHELQTNKENTRMGISYYREFLDLSKRYNLFDIHEKVAGLAFAEEFKRYVKTEASSNAIDGIKYSFSRYGSKSGNKALILLMKEAPMKIVVIGINTWAVASIRSLLRQNHLIYQVVLRFKRAISKV